MFYCTLFEQRVHISTLPVFPCVTCPGHVAPGTLTTSPSLLAHRPVTMLESAHNRWIIIFLHAWLRWELCDMVAARGSSGNRVEKMNMPNRLRTAFFHLL